MTPLPHSVVSALARTLCTGWIVAAGLGACSSGASPASDESLASNWRCGGNGDAGTVTSGGDGGHAAPLTDAANDGVATPAEAGAASPGWSLVAIDTPLRPFVDYVNVGSSGWSPEADGWPMLAQWENQTTRTAMRFQPFTVGQPLSPAQIMALLPAVAPSSRTIDITASPYNARVSPSDATSALQSALDDAGSMATQGAPVDVLVPAGTFNYSNVLNVPHDVRLRRWPEDSGGILAATDPANSAIHLAGDRSGALFLVVTSPAASTRLTTPQACGIWVGSDGGSLPITHGALAVGNEVVTPAAGHVFGMEEGDLGLQLRSRRIRGFVPPHGPIKSLPGRRKPYTDLGHARGRSLRLRWL